MAISKIVYKESANATPVTWMDATTATAAAADITAPKTAMLADGVMTTGTGSGGGGGVTPAPAKDVNFIDYDGTIVYSYTKAEFALLDALPANPSHSGLTAQGWNWTKQQISDQLTAAPNQKVWVGQQYITADGKTKIKIRLTDAGLLSPYLRTAVNGTIEVDWGDGSGTDTVTGTSLTTSKVTLHNYATIGEYEINIDVKSGSFTFYYSYILAHATSTSNNSRRYNNSIVAVYLGSGFASMGYYAFANISPLQNLTIPNGVTATGNNTFYECSSLQSVTIPSSVTSIGTNAFYNCFSLQSVAIPSGVTSIGNNAFYECYSLQSLVIPSGVTSIGSGVFQYCRGLQSVTIPSDVTSIGSNAFYECHSLYKLIFKSSTPPTVSSSSAFSSLPTDCIIYVPSGKLNDYKTASNYPSPSTYTYMEET